MNGYEALQTIWFEGEMLPKWAQLLDLAARLCPVEEETRGWFARFARTSGVDDARAILVHATALKGAIESSRDTLLSELRRTSEDAQAQQILQAWRYALDSMEQQCRGNQTCTWRVEGSDEADPGDYGDGNVSLRRV